MVDQSECKESAINTALWALLSRGGCIPLAIARYQTPRWYARQSSILANDRKLHLESKISERNYSITLSYNAIAVSESTKRSQEYCVKTELVIRTACQVRLSFGIDEEFAPIEALRTCCSPAPKRPSSLIIVLRLRDCVHHEDVMKPAWGPCSSRRSILTSCTSLSGSVRARSQY